MKNSNILPLPFTWGRIFFFGLLLSLIGVSQVSAQNGTDYVEFIINQAGMSLPQGPALKLFNKIPYTGGKEESITMKKPYNGMDNPDELIFTYFNEDQNIDFDMFKVMRDGRFSIGGDDGRTPKSLLHLDSREFNATWSLGAGLPAEDDPFNRVRFTNINTGDNITDGFAMGILLDGSAVINQNENKALHFSTNNTRRMTIDNTGKVAIGDPSALICHPDATLTVDGPVFISPAGGSPADIMACEINDQHLVEDYALWIDGGVVGEGFAISNATDWADFVFEEDYELSSLEEVEAHINEKGHLPTVASEAEVKNGYNLHEMNKQLLQTIEELTLHVIAQNKQQKGLLDRVVELEEQLAALKQ